MFLDGREPWAWLLLACAASEACGSDPGAGPGGPSADAGTLDAATDAGTADASGRDARPDGPSAARDASPECQAPPADAGDCAAPLVPGADRKCTMTVGGQAREVLLYAPKGYDPCRPAALVVDAHGSNETDAEQAGLQPFLTWPGGLGSGWRLVADQEGFLVAQPQGLNDAWQASDTDFMLAIPDWVRKVATLDPARVFLTGISNGGGLTYWTACRDPGVFQGFAPVSGYGDPTCAASHPTPFLAFHSPDDKLVPYADGQAAFQSWVTANHCTQGPTPSMQFGGPGTDPRPVCLQQSSSSQWSLTTCATSAPVSSCQTWSQCDGGNKATFCTVAPDMVNQYALTGGHILYINGTGLSLAAVAWAALQP